MPPCPLCHSDEKEHYFADRRRAYLICRCCSLVYVPQRYHLTSTQEQAQYDLHQNSPGDLGYRRFLGRLFEPLKAILAPDARGLDFGCGPGPTLSVMFQEVGHEMELYDKFYACDDMVFEKSYDFITATEVVEHLQQPGIELARLFECLQPNGVLGIMTKLVSGRQAFTRWHYKNDPTHISFFSHPTFEWLAAAWQAEVEFIGNDVVLIHRGSH